ncbi:MAG: Flagellar hook-associated protein 1 [Pseudomonadota bacterium]|jgi:flagellar hook-associated protein FlgK
MLGIGTGAVQVYQRALSTVSNNVANMATEGYSRQEAVIQDNAPRELASVYFGTGSRVTHIQRVYDAFIEAGLRGSTSDLETQTPLVNYSSRVVDTMGSQVTGLTSALDSFFASARALSNDAASIELRSIFLSEADGLAARFRTLGGQFDALDAETQEAVQVDVGRINTLASQLSLVNTELARKSTIAKQPAQLLDHRDQLLRELSSVARIKVKESLNGMVDISLGATDKQGQIVSGRKAFTLDAVFDGQGMGVKLIIDPVGKKETLTGVSAGNLGGLLNFRSQILGAAVAELDFLAQSVAGQFNATHRLNMNMSGELGSDVFTIDPVFQLDDRAVRGQLSVQWDVIEPSETEFHNIELQYDHDAGRWAARDMVSGATSGGTDIIRINGLQIRINGQAEQGDRLVMTASMRPAVGIRKLLDDPRGVAAAAALRVIEFPGNASGADAMIAWQPDRRDELNLRSIEAFPASSAWQTDGVAFDNSSAQPASVLGKIPTGFDEVRLSLQSAINEPIDLQVFTRDGRHLAGRALTDLEQAELIGPGTGFVSGASYSDDYLNGQGEQAYLGLQVHYGARAVPTPFEERASNGERIGDTVRPAALEARRLPTQTLAAGQALIESGALTLNGAALGEFRPTSQPVQAREIAVWLNSEIERTGQTAQLHAESVNELRVPTAQLMFDAPLRLNGVDVIASGSPPIGDAVSLARQINQASELTGVVADIGADGAFVLRSLEGRDILIEPADDLVGAPANALALPAGRFSAQLRITANDPKTTVQLGIGVQGSPADLSRLGFSTEVWIDGQIPEDLIVFSTGAGRGILSAQYSAGTIEALPAMREREFSIEFVEADRWRLTDSQSGTVLAERPYDPVAGIHYRGVQISLSRPPAKGDVYTFDGNQDGVWDNAGMIQLANLEKSRQFIPGGRTIAESWLDRLNTLGNLSNQSKIAQTALKVVHQQAIEARDRVSGVSLDEEAADLIRFQQAYQASAKIIQTANQVFDLVANIR